MLAVLFVPAVRYRHALCFFRPLTTRRMTVTFLWLVRFGCPPISEALIFSSNTQGMQPWCLSGLLLPVHELHTGIRPRKGRHLSRLPGLRPRGSAMPL
jgi:hypothetical protein